MQIDLGKRAGIQFRCDVPIFTVIKMSGSIYTSCSGRANRRPGLGWRAAISSEISWMVWSGIPVSTESVFHFFAQKHQNELKPAFPLVHFCSAAAVIEEGCIPAKISRRFQPVLTTGVLPKQPPLPWPIQIIAVLPPLYLLPSTRLNQANESDN